MKTRVLIVGGGPVGLTLAMDLAWRGIDVVVAERRPPDDPPNVKCGQIGARSMEIFRRLGVADKLRCIGLPADYPNDIVSATSVTGIELSRVLIPARGARATPAAAGPDTAWPTPEHTHRCNQKFFEPVLFAHAAEQPRIRVVHRTEITDLAQGEQGVTASAVDLDSGTRTSIACDYLVGCDGASSFVRKSIGSEFVRRRARAASAEYRCRAPLRFCDKAVGLLVAAAGLARRPSGDLLERKPQVGGACTSATTRYRGAKITYPPGASVLGMMQKSQERHRFLAELFRDLL